METTAKADVYSKVDVAALEGQKDEAHTAILRMAALWSGETFAERQGREVSESQRRATGELAQLLVKVLAPVQTRLDALEAKVEALEAPADAPSGVLTAAGLAASSPVRAASWSEPALDLAEILDAARVVIRERQFPAGDLPGDVQRLAEALGLGGAEERALTYPEHSEAACRALGGVPWQVCGKLIADLGKQLGSEPTPTHLRALAHQLDMTARLVRSRAGVRS